MGFHVRRSIFDTNRLWASHTHYSDSLCIRSWLHVIPWLVNTVTTCRRSMLYPSTTDYCVGWPWLDRWLRVGWGEDEGMGVCQHWPRNGNLQRSESANGLSKSRTGLQQELFQMTVSELLSFVITISLSCFRPQTQLFPAVCAHTRTHLHFLYQPHETRGISTWKTCSLVWRMHAKGQTFLISLPTLIFPCCRNQVGVRKRACALHSCAAAHHTGWPPDRYCWLSLKQNHKNEKENKLFSWQMKRIISNGSISII